MCLDWASIRLTSPRKVEIVRCCAGCDLAGKGNVVVEKAEIVLVLDIFLLHLFQLLLLVIADFLSSVGFLEFGGITFLEIGSILLNG